MHYYSLLMYTHVLGACVLLGTGTGIAFFMLMAHRSGQASIVAHTARIVVMADFTFTATAVVIQPITGYLLAKFVGWPVFSGWVGLSLLLYVIVGAFWLPVVWIQMRLKTLAEKARDDGTPLPNEYHRWFRVWFACGVPAFACVLAIVWLMQNKPIF